MEVLEIIVANSYVGFEELLTLWRTCRAIRSRFNGISVQLGQLELYFPSLEFWDKAERVSHFQERLNCCKPTNVWERLICLLASENYTEEALYVLRSATAPETYFLAEVARLHGGRSFARELKNMAADSSAFNSWIGKGTAIPFVNNDLNVDHNYWRWLTAKIRVYYDYNSDMLTDRVLQFFARCITGRSKVALAYLCAHLDWDIPQHTEQYKFCQTTYLDLLAVFAHKNPVQFAEIWETAQWHYPPAENLLRQILYKRDSMTFATFTFSNTDQALHRLHFI